MGHYLSMGHYSRKYGILNLFLSNGKEEVFGLSQHQEKTALE